MFTTRLCKQKFVAKEAANMKERYAATSSENESLGKLNTTLSSSLARKYEPQ